MSPDDYRRAAEARHGRVTTVEFDARTRPTETVEDMQLVVIGTPDEPEEQPNLRQMISRSGESTWIPAAWEKALATNDDSILAKDGGGLKLYDALLDDDQAFSALQQRRLAITSRDWQVAPGNPDDPRSVQAAEDFRRMLKEVGFDRITTHLHYAVWYGYGVGEAIWGTRVIDGRLLYWLDGFVVPDRRHFGFTHKGELRFVAPYGGGVEDESLPANKFVVVRTGGSHDFAFYGLGLAHWAYWPIFFKRAGLKFWALYLEKFGMPTVAIGFPETERNDPAKLEARLQAAVAVGQDRAVLVPEQTLKDNLLQLIEAERTGSGASSYSTFIEAQDDALIRVILGQTGTSKATPGGLGGDGQAKKDEGVKRELVKADSDLISEALNSTVAKWVTRWNYGPDVAPPTVYRVLDDEEDLSAVAERDVKLNGIGIKRTEESVRDVYGDGYEVDRLSEEDKAANAAALAQAKGAAAGAVPPPANDNRAQIAAARREFGVDDVAPLYVSRKLLPASARALAAWAKKNGFTATVPLDEMHVTVLYSKQPVDWFAMAGEGWDWGEVVVEQGGPRKVEALGDEGAVVIRFASPALRYRHDDMIARGASHDFPEYLPHVTFTYDGKGVDLAAIEPFDGELRFGPEKFEALKVDAPFDPAKLDFGADEEEAIDRLVAALVEDSSPVFAAMAEQMRGALQGVRTIEGARVALLEAVERLPVERLAKLTALPMLAVRAGAIAGDEGAVQA